MNSPRIGVVGIPGGWSSETLADEVESRTGFRLLIDMSEVAFDSADHRVTFREHNLCQLDAIIIKKICREYSPDMLDRLELLRFVEESGVQIFSRPSRVLRLVDRLACTITLRRAGIPVPPTVVTGDVSRAVAAVRNFGAAVLKPLFSSKARGMTLLSASTPNLEAAVTAFRDDGNPTIYVQKKVEIPGRDLGVAFLGGEYLGAYARVAGEEAWNTTIHSGGHYEAHEPSAEVRRLAFRAQALFELDFTSVDVVETSTGPAVFEVSAFGGYRGLKDALGLDASRKVLTYVLNKLKVTERA